MTGGPHPARHQDDLAPLCSLDDDTRRRLYDVVVAAGEPVSRDQASAAAQVDRSLAAYHLDKLVEEGLLVTSFARPAGRGGPGAGRPAKYYRRADREFAVSVPPRDYELVAEIFARAAEGDASGRIASLLRDAATQTGRQLADGGDGEAGLLGHLRHQGYEPYDDHGVLRLRNCPFHHLARQHTELVCSMNLAVLSGLVEALGAPVRPKLDPVPGQCCVALEQD
jgi:predicted ArsR family transcriptional regulator